MVDLHIAAFVIGIVIVFGSHISLYTHMKQHAQYNIAAACMISYYFAHKQGFITF